MIWWILLGVVSLLVLWALHDIIQRRHAVVRNFPIIGHFRYWLEKIGPELRQYLVTNNNEERPFSRDQRRWIYSSSKNQNNYFGFGTDQDLEDARDYVIVKHSTFPLHEPIPGDANYDPDYRLPCAKVLGKARGRAKAFRPASAFNISAMSFGSLSAHAISAFNQGAKLADCMHNTGEGGISRHHQHGGKLMMQIGTAYFGCRTPDGAFSMERLVELVEQNPVLAIEVKLSQGAKPSKGGILPAAKITPEIAAIRGIEMGKDCISPSAHATFHDADSMLDWVEAIAEATGLPVGIKSAVGEMGFWHDLARMMDNTGRGVDFITIDGGEGGTGAAPLAYTDHVSLPFKMGMSRVYKVFAERGITENIVFVGSGRLGFPEQCLVAFALGCDMVHVAREAMISIGCIQAQICHTGHCPTGVTTQNKWLMRGLVPDLKAPRLAGYLRALRKDVLMLCRSCSVSHPAFISSDHLDFLYGAFRSATVQEVFGYEIEWGFPGKADLAEIKAIMESMPRPPETLRMAAAAD